MKLILLACLLLAPPAFANVYVHLGFKANNSGHSFEWYSEDQAGELGRPEGVARVETRPATDKEKRLYASQTKNDDRRKAKKLLQPLKDKATLTNAERDAILKFLLRNELED
jgi:hypothetical protein